ncbi:SIS domain-containing protein [Candidatus Bathyarchaeota archaeon]|nr:MAG: SIS domain-containing protein [Candidatus Bathyarchaeota archaeon]
MLEPLVFLDAEPCFPVVFVCPKDETHKTIIGNIMEMKARGASIISVVEEDDEEIKNLSDEYFEVAGSLPESLSPIAFIVPLQLLALWQSRKVVTRTNPAT